mgnify:FL=1
MQFLLYIALYESKCILVGVALRPQVKAEIVCQNKFYKCRKPVGVALRPPPVADKGSKALSEITSKRQYIYVQRIATIFQTGGYYPPALMNVYVYTYILMLLKLCVQICTHCVQPCALHMGGRTRFAPTLFR